MKKHIICLGDSNTHGYCADPKDCADPQLARFNEDERWTCLLQKAQTTECWGPGGKPNILIVVPPIIGEGVLISPVAEETGSE